MRRTALLLVLLVAVSESSPRAAAARRTRPRRRRPYRRDDDGDDGDRDHRDRRDRDGDDGDRETETEPTVTTPVIEGDPAAGKEVFLGASACGGCHTLADAGSTAPSARTSTTSQPGEELVLDRVTNGQGGMPSFSSTLSEQQIADVAAYVSSVAGS